MISKLALGTAQFGTPYGVSNQIGQVGLDSVAKILNHAFLAGMSTLDTAIAYGESEDTLGKVGVRQWQVVSKLPVIPESSTDVAQWVQQEVQDSLIRLNLSRLYGLLLHRSDQLLTTKGEALYQELVALKEKGIVEKIGITVYDPCELDVLFPRFKFDLIQIPFNILDQRFATSGWLVKLSQAGVVIHTRSVFLQGLLLMNPQRRPAMFNRWQILWDKWDLWLKKEALTPLQACLGFVMAQPEVDRVIVGVDSVMQLQEIVSAVVPARIAGHQSLVSDDLELLNPSNWRKYHE